MIVFSLIDKAAHCLQFRYPLGRQSELFLGDF